MHFVETLVGVREITYPYYYSTVIYFLLLYDRRNKFKKTGPRVIRASPE